MYNQDKGTGDSTAAKARRWQSVRITLFQTLIPFICIIKPSFLQNGLIVLDNIHIVGLLKFQFALSLGRTQSPICVENAQDTCRMYTARSGSCQIFHSSCKIWRMDISSHIHEILRYSTGFARKCNSAYVHEVDIKSLIEIRSKISHQQSLGNRLNAFVASPIVILVPRRMHAEYALVKLSCTS